MRPGDALRHEFLQEQGGGHRPGEGGIGGIGDIGNGQRYFPGPRRVGWKRWVYCPESSLAWRSLKVGTDTQEEAYLSLSPGNAGVLAGQKTVGIDAFPSFSRRGKNLHQVSAISRLGGRARLTGHAL